MREIVWELTKFGLKWGAPFIGILLASRIIADRLDPSLYLSQFLPMIVFTILCGVMGIAIMRPPARPRKRGP